MDMNKILQWMDLAKKYQSTDFWNDIFEQSSFEEFMNGNFDFNQTEGSNFEPSKRKNFPAVDIYLTDSEVIIIIDLPGYSKEDIELSLSNTRLKVKGNKQSIYNGETVQQERYLGEFERTIQLPEPTYPNNLQAKFMNGQLLISYKRHFTNEENVPID